MFTENIEQKGKVLEIGIGEGRDAVWMAEQGFEIEGIDNAKTGIENLQKIAQERKMRNISLRCTSAQEFNYGKERCLPFDFYLDKTEIVLYNYIIHIDFMQEIWVKERG